MSIMNECEKYLHTNIHFKDQINVGLNEEQMKYIFQQENVREEKILKDVDAYMQKTSDKFLKLKNSVVSPTSILYKRDGVARSKLYNADQVQII